MNLMPTLEPNYLMYKLCEDTERHWCILRANKIIDNEDIDSKIFCSYCRSENL